MGRIQSERGRKAGAGRGGKDRGVRKSGKQAAREAAGGAEERAAKRMYRERRIEMEIRG